MSLVSAELGVKWRRHEVNRDRAPAAGAVRRLGRSRQGLMQLSEPRQSMRRRRSPQSQVICAVIARPIQLLRYRRRDVLAAANSRI